MNYAALLGMGIFMLMFGVWWGLAAWTVHVVLYIFLNSSVNSVCHMVGYRNFDKQGHQPPVHRAAHGRRRAAQQPSPVPTSARSRCAATKSTPHGPSFACWKLQARQSAAASVAKAAA